MKNKFLIALSAALISTAALAQKDEMKALKKVYDKDAVSVKDITEYDANLAKLDGMSASLSEGDLVYFNYYKNIRPLLDLGLPENRNNPMAAMSKITPDKLAKMIKASTDVLDYEEKTGKKVFTNDIKEDIGVMKPVLIDAAINLGKQKQFKQSAELFYMVYLMDKKDQDNLYYAASYAVNGEDWDKALGYYQELKRLNYTGEGTLYFAKNAATDQEETFPTKADRDRFVKLGSHNTPREEKIPSRRGEIYRNIALILNQQGKTEEAKSALAAARAENPNDLSLIIEEANVYLQLKDFNTYKKLVNEALAKDPNNADLVYNLGVIAAPNDPAEAEKHYKRAIEIDPKYINAYLNLAILKLEPEKALIDEMNKLGTSEKDNKRYAVLKKQREDIFHSALPYLEKAHELNPKNEDVYQTLYNVYGALEMFDKRKEIKARAGK